MNTLHPVEEATIRAFFTPQQRSRWIERLASAQGMLAYYLDECGERRMVLQRD